MIEINELIEHTLLRPEATVSDIMNLCQEAVHASLHAVCVAPVYVPLAANLLRPSRVEVRPMNCASASERSATA